MTFNLDNYEPVAPRLARWRKDVLDRGFEPTVKTELIASEPGKWCQFRATLYINSPISLEGVKTMMYWIATGHAEEHATERGVNATSHMENCETSAIGRALANCGYAGSDASKRPSREEMSKVVRYEGDMKITEQADKPSDKQLWKYKSELKKVGKLPPLNIASMTKYEVSKAIDGLINSDATPEPQDMPEEPF